MVPEFDIRGNLPPGIHIVCWGDFLNRFGYNPLRLRLIDGLRDAVDILSGVGCTAIYMDGSFVTAKALPQDYDAVWETGGVNLQLLRVVEPLFFDFTDKRSAQKARFGGEFFPSGIAAGPKAGTFIDFFQSDRMSNAKGLILIQLKDLTP